MVIDNEIGFAFFVQVGAGAVFPFKASLLQYQPVNGQFLVPVHERCQYLPVPVQHIVHCPHGIAGRFPFFVVEGILADEEDHADEMADLLAKVDSKKSGVKI